MSVADSMVDKKQETIWEVENFEKNTLKEMFGGIFNFEKLKFKTVFNRLIKFQKT